MKKATRNGAIDFLRFVFCVIIVLRHSLHALEGVDGPMIMPGGAMGVEFFFVVSGYLMTCSAAKRLNSGSPLSASAETNAFMKRKASSLLPELVVASICSMGLVLISLIPSGEWEMLYEFVKRIWNPLLLSSAGFGSTNELWYLSAMIIVMLAYYPLLIKRFDGFVRIIAPLIAMFSLGYLARKYNSLLDPSYFDGILYKGMIRAIGEIALGISVYPLIQALSKQRLKKGTRILVSIGNLLSFILIFLIMFYRQNRKFDFSCLALITFLIILTFSHQGVFADKFDNKFSSWLGKLSLTLYLSNRWVAQSINNVYNYCVKSGNRFGFGLDMKHDYIIIVATYLVSVVIACTVIYLICQFIRKHNDSFKASLRKKLIDET